MRGKNVIRVHTLHVSCNASCICCSASNIDNLYQATYAHEQKAHGLQWARSMGVAMMVNKKTLSMMLVGRAEWFKAFFADFLYLRVAQTPRCRDLAILWWWWQTTDKTDSFIVLCMHACWVITVHECNVIYIQWYLHACYSRAHNVIIMYTYMCIHKD